jgi:serine/threonine-protein kinase
MKGASVNSGEPGSRVGSRFGPYQLTRLLGRGGMGEVYEAEDVRKHRVVALKLISTQFSDHPEHRARMQREADTAGRLNEPHVVPIHDYGEIDGQFFVEMRLIDGISLRSLLKRYGPMSPARAVAIIRQVASALDAAHGAGIMHRDVKPENILVTDDDFAYLVDFGIARAATDPGLTQVGTAVGTYNYMAPERFSGDDVTYRADIYSLACVLGECLMGSPPYRADSIERMIAAHLTQPPPQPSRLRPGSVPAAMDEVIARGMDKRPEDRYRSAGELALAANQALTDHERDQASTILRRGEQEEALQADAGAGRHEAAVSPGDETMSAPVPSAGGDGGWRSPSGPPPSYRPAEPPSFAKEPSFGSKRKLGFVLGAAALALIVAAGLIAYLVTRSSHPSGPTASGQTEVQFSGINFHLSPGGVALGNAGNLYVTNQGMHGRVLKLPPGSNTPTLLPFNGLYQPQGLAVDANGTLYVSDFNNRVVKLAAGSNNQTVLPFPGLNYPEGVAVDADGSVYVADRGNNRVMKLAADSDEATALPFSGLNHPDGVAVDSSGTVYVTDTDNNRVLKLTAGSNDQIVLPFTGITVPWGIAVDDGGDVYVTEHDGNKVMKLAAGSTTATVLPFTGLNTPLAVAVGKDGNVYVADRGNNRVVKLSG